MRTTFVQVTLLLHDWTILRIYDATVRRLQCCFIPLYVSTAHFAFTPLYDSTILRCYCTPTVSFVLYHCTFIRIYASTAFFAFTRLDDSTHLRCYCTLTVSFILHHCTFLRLTLHPNSLLNRSPGLNRHSVIK